MTDTMLAALCSRDKPQVIAVLDDAHHLLGATSLGGPGAAPNLVGALMRLRDQAGLALSLLLIMGCDAAPAVCQQLPRLQVSSTLVWLVACLMYQS